MKVASVLVALFALWLACDLPPTGTTISDTQVELTQGVTVDVVNGVALVGTGHFKLLNLDTAPSGVTKFRARWRTATSNWSDWSVPFVPQSPAVTSGVRIVKD